MIYTPLMFVGVCCSAVDESNAGAVVLADRPDEMAVDCYDIYGTPDMERITAMFTCIPRRRYAGLAVRAAWSPDQSAALPSWCLVTTSRGEQARLAVRRDVDEKWTLIDFGYAPWFAASTAGAIRAWLENDFSAPFRFAEDPRLMAPVREMVTPPTHEDGRI